MICLAKNAIAVKALSAAAVSLGFCSCMLIKLLVNSVKTVNPTAN